jgi:hypothetical protein
LADRKAGWRSVYYAIGHDVTAKGFTPSSIPTNEVLSILNELLPDFTKEMQGFCAAQSSRRNAEVHSGEEAFSKVSTADWLPRFYESCDVLLRWQGKSIEDLFDDAATAREMIASLSDGAAKAVARDIKLHKETWEKKDGAERATACSTAALWAMRQAGHRVACPACACNALVHGSPQGSVSTDYGDQDVIVQRQTMLPSSFECVACGLKIAGYSKLSACALGDVFTATARFSPAEFFGLHTEEELEEARAVFEPEWEEDNNE